MEMKDMKRTPVEKSAYLNPQPSSPDNEYPYGLRLCLGKDEFEKLGIDMPKVGSEYMLMAVCKVVSTRQFDDGEASPEKGADLQIVQMCLVPEEGDKPTAAEVMYPKG